MQTARNYFRDTLMAIHGLLQFVNSKANFIILAPVALLLSLRRRGPVNSRAKAPLAKRREKGYCPISCREGLSRSL